ncbi:hypothetical protein Tco_0714774 [Tanacetum coccineum]
MPETMGTHDEEAGSSRNKRSRQHETLEEVLLPQVHHEFLLWGGCNKDVKSRYNTRLANLLPKHIYSPCMVNWDVLNRMGYDGEIDDMLRIKLQLFHEFYSTYEFDKVCDELQTKKIIKFRLGGRAHSLTLLEFVQRLGLYHADELDEDGFNIYFEGRLRSDKHFNAQEYWLSISREENLSLSRSHTFTIRYPVLRTPKWVCKCGLVNCKVDEEKRSWKTRALTDDVIKSLSAPIYCRDLDTTTLRELIDSEGRLIPEDPQPGVPRVGIPRPREHLCRTYMIGLGVFEHMAGVYRVPLQGTYNLPGYAQPQYDQYYQQYPPQYQPPQQLHDQDDE